MSFPSASDRLTALLRAAAPLAAMFLLTGSALISCEGTSDEDSDTPSDGTRPNSAAMGRWTPNTAFDTCTKDFHDTFYVIGPDGRKYPPWHPPTATDPATGRVCSFGHEHGRDPRGSALWESVRSHYAYDANSNGTIDTVERDASGVPFGYASEQLRVYNAANGIANANRDEDHVSYKIAWENGIARARTVNGQVQTFDMACDVLSALHQETHSAESYASNLHEVLYAIDCTAVAWAASEGWNPGLADARAFHAADPDGFLGGFDGGDLVATVSAVRYPEGFGFLAFYIVRPDRRGQGAGLALWTAAMARLADVTAGIDGVVAQQPHVGECVCLEPEQQVAHAGPVDLDAEVVSVRVAFGERGEGVAVAEADLQPDRPVVAEERGQVKRYAGVFDAEPRPEQQNVRFSESDLTTGRST